VAPCGLADVCGIEFCFIAAYEERNPRILQG